MTAPLRIPVSPPPAAPEAYDVVIERGALARLGEIAWSVAPAARYAIICDAHVAGVFGDAARTALGGCAPTEIFSFAAGESHKTRTSWAELCDAMFARSIGRDACVVALGGGVTGDLAGFVAATYMRGVPWIQVPTSLLAMIDASIGGKTGVDVPAGKNLVGAFTQPRVVVVDPDLLATLPAHELRNGLAEAVKHGAIADAAYHDWIAGNAAGLASCADTLMPFLVQRSIEIKAGVVSADPHERGARATLNFGHTVAHAIERLTDFRVPHGQAVAMGMVAEARIGEAAGVTVPGTALRLVRSLGSVGLPDRIPAGLDPAQLLAATASDKKARGARVHWALIARIGAAARGPGGEWTLEVPRKTVLQALQS
jgi:3-dehydroquinate synthase